MPVSRDSMLRLLGARPDPPIDQPKVIGADDVALRRGNICNIVIIDILTHQPLDLLADRTCDCFSQPEEGIMRRAPEPHPAGHRHNDLATTP
jgi:hypothetical protein